MVAISKVEDASSNLFSSEAVASLEKLLSAYTSELPAMYTQIAAKKNAGEDLSFNEKKYLSWVRHSLAFKTKQTSPRKILESWTLDVVELLSEKWVEVFSAEDPVVLAFFGKLGSGELNLSSDIDVVFLGDSELKLNKVRRYISEVGDLNEIPSGFKVDLDLRPGGTSAPMICSPARLGDHLWNSSDPWERYSYTRMDVQLGRGDLIKEVLDIRDRFCYRKYLSSDFFHSFVSMRKDYRVEKTKDSLNVKLGQGGIRDIELFVQTFQILHGGKDVKFRGLSTFDLLDVFIREGVNKSIFEKLKTNYALLRQAEGELHGLNEQGEFEWKHQGGDFDDLLFTAAEDTHKIINEYIESSTNIFGTKEGVRSSSFRDKIEDALEGSGDLKTKALANLDQYFLNKKKQFRSYYSAILSQQKVLDAFVDLLKYSDYGCQVLSRRPGLLDVFLLRRKAPDFETEEDFLNSLSDIKMVQRILASSEFKKNRDIKKLGDKVTASYEMILKEIMDPADGIDLLFFGKMATGEMGLSSDLDFIMITENEKLPVKKARSIYKKLSYLTVFGPLVPYDTDGGPMGKASPILLGWKSVEDFLRSKAEPWQKLMYLKQRCLFSDKDLLYLDEGMSKEEISSLFDVLRERLGLSTYKKDPYKLSPGGLFHTEFITGALLLRFGVQPRGNLKIFELLEKIELMTYEGKRLKKLADNYYKIAAKREEAVVEVADSVLIDTKILEESFAILEDLSEKYLYSLKVEM